MQSFQFKPDQVAFLQQISEDESWIWADDAIEQWNETNKYLEFYELWRSSDSRHKFLSTFPYRLSLGMNDLGKSLLPFDRAVTQILITKAYDNMLHRLLAFRMQNQSHLRGAVVTGQPGVGKSTFIKYMLVLLISARQAVLLCRRAEMFLFFRGKVYARKVESGFGDLPERQLKYCPVWTLIDMDYAPGEPPLDRGDDVWPIQATSPKPARWRSWTKQQGAPVFGMPLWDMNELMEGLYIHPDFPAFRDRLTKHLPPHAGSVLPTTNGEMVDAALQVLQTWVAEQDENMAEEAGQPRASVDSMDIAFEILVNNATEEFGFAPRDVYDGVFFLGETRDQHTTALRDRNFSDLAALVQDFSVTYNLDVSSHRVVVVEPRQISQFRDRWTVDFKSVRIAEQAVEWMRKQEDAYLRHTYDLLHKIPAGSTMAGWVFEGIAHRKLSGGWTDGDMPQPTLMLFNLRDPPTFSTVPSSSPSPDTPAFLSSFTPLCTESRTAVQIDFRKLTDVTLDNKCYYKPTAANNPLFDSFTVSFTPDRLTVIISVFQITISPKHQGSSQGYVHIRKVISHVRRRLKAINSGAVVRVAYYLVCPEGESQHEWLMPTDWNKSVKINDHRGHVFSLRIPASHM